MSDMLASDEERAEAEGNQLSYGNLLIELPEGVLAEQIDREECGNIFAEEKEGQVLDLAGAQEVYRDRGRRIEYSEELDCHSYRRFEPIEKVAFLCIYTMEPETAQTDWVEDDNEMNGVRNYQKELDRVIDNIIGKKECRTKDETRICVPALFLHSCCAPCSSYVLEYLRVYFRITVFYYNPNISMEDEYRKRVVEQKRLIAAYNAESERRQRMAADNAEADSPVGYPIEIVEGDYEPERFFEMAKGLEQCPEGGERCFACYEMRLRKTAELARAGGYDYFATTLTISPLKNAVKLNETGERLAEEYGVAWLPSDFKKRGGYQRSIALSKEYDLYRQDYCGCVFSRAQRDRQTADNVNRG